MNATIFLPSVHCTYYMHIAHVCLYSVILYPVFNNGRPSQNPNMQIYIIQLIQDSSQKDQP